MRTSLVVIVVLLLIAVVFCIPIFLGVNGWGPINYVEATVNRTYVDISGKGENKASHYMVATDNGVFEIDNGIVLGMWNADELYGQLKEGQRYLFTTKGNKVVGFWYQEYPYIIKASPIAAPAHTTHPPLR